MIFHFVKTKKPTHFCGAILKASWNNIEVHFKANKALKSSYINNMNTYLLPSRLLLSAPEFNRINPVHTGVAGFTAGREFLLLARHPAPKKMQGKCISLSC